MPAVDKRGQLRLVASSDGRNDSVTIHADAAVYAGLFDGNERAELAIDTSRKAYVHIVRGALEVNGTRLNAGDALLLQQENSVVIANGSDAEVLVFDLTP